MADTYHKLWNVYRERYEKDKSSVQKMQTAFNALQRMVFGAEFFAADGSIASNFVRCLIVCFWMIEPLIKG